MKKLLPIILALFGLGIGVGVGKVLQPPAEVVELNPCGDGSQPVGHAANAAEEEPEEDPSVTYIKMNNQFVVPVVNTDDVAALVVMSLSLEVKVANTEIVYQREPKLRDVFLQVLFDHANVGGFDGPFTESGTMTLLRNALKEAAQKTVGDLVTDVLVIDLVRQDL